MTKGRVLAYSSALVILIAVSGSCDRITASRDTTANQKQPTSGRFIVLQGTGAASVGVPGPILRVDSMTGETWRLSDDGHRWVGVEDELQRAGTYNPETKKVEWGVKLPDGRDLNDLSKEELVRYLAAAIRNGQAPNPNDPLGIRDVKK